ncbi:MAG: acyltransferase family protein [Pirellulales bacterium]|nr:acyltransferase family protein [Pirellulales bacterium]
MCQTELTPALVSKLPTKRYHDLDALRATAMLLGILLHSLMSLVGIPFWPAQDIQQNPAVYGTLLTIIHGFRMPLFFLVSGFFTAMMWRSRGLAQLVKHRAQRILLPLIVGIAVLGPMINNMGRLAELKQSQRRVDNQQGVEFLGDAEESIWNAAKKGDVVAITRHLANGSDINGKDDKQATPLHWAAGLGHPDAVDFLVQNGAEVDSRDGRRSTPLHWAAFFSQPESMRRLIIHHANVDSKNDDQTTPLEAAKFDRRITQWIAQILGIRIDLSTVMATRDEVVVLLSGSTAGTEKDIESIWEAAQKGDLEFITTHADTGGDINAPEPTSGSSPLLIAALYGQLEAARSLIEHGADIQNKNPDGSTPLHVAAFFGYREIVELLLAEGADPNLKNNKGETPLDTVSASWNPALEGLYQWIASMLKLELDYDRISKARPEIARILDGGDRQHELLGKLVSFYQNNYTAFGTFVFHHLWFLYDLLLLIIVFFVFACLADTFGWNRLPAWVISSSFCWLWLVPLTFVPQYFMNGFGADTSIFLTPNWTKLAYYGIFFGFGAMCFSCRDFEKNVGRYWPACFLLAIPTFVAGLYFMNQRGEDDFRNHACFNFCAATYAWLVIFGMIGFFRKYFSSENKTIRYISDSSYWLYLAHLPLVQVLQIWVSDWPYPSFLKLTFVCVVTSSVLLLMYEYLVRYTWVGTMLNGKRTRPQSSMPP